MSRKIFRGIWLSCVVVFLACLVLILGAMYGYYSSLKKEELKDAATVASRGVELSGEAFLQDLDATDYRVTWIAADGTVLFDSRANVSEMENHLQREEVQQALSTGTGQSSRFSATLSEKELYYAVLLSDGTVLRLATDQPTIWALVLSFAQPICLVLVISLVLSLVLGSRISKKIVAPINNIDLDHPMNYIDDPDLDEVQPLLRRIDRQQEQIKKDKTELERTSQIRQEFTANVSHELKTPLHAISGYAELLENGMARPEDVKPFASKIREESIRMTKLVEDIIDLTKLDNGASGMEWEEVDLSQIAQNAADSLETTAEAARVSLTVRGQKALMYGIAQILYSIVYNLCDNAIKYNHPGGSVLVQVQSLADKIQLSVSDTGIGIDKEDQDRIFERFYRVDKSRSKAVGGTGLGLSIVKHGVMIHHAEISVDSEPGKGSSFTVVFSRDARSAAGETDPSVT